MRAIRYSKPFVFLACLLPAAWLVWGAFHEALGANPIQEITHVTGDWILRFLVLSLMITPVRKLTGWNPIIRYRRMLGLFAFFYACVHLTVYLVIDLGGYWSQLLIEIAKRPYMTVGFSAWLMLVPLAITSTRGMMRRLGGRWQKLHRLVYPAALLACLHFLWLVKADHREPLVYLAILTTLLLARVRWPRHAGVRKTASEST